MKTMTTSDPAAERLVEELFDAHARPLRAFVARLVGNDWQVAEDVVQETLTRAWQSAGALLAGDRARLRPWLVTVARRIVIDRHRAQQARPIETAPPEPDGVAVADPTAHVATALTVRAALRELSPSHREILLETYFRERTTQEAAQALGLPAGTVKSRVYYALRELRDRLTEEEAT